MLRRIGDISGNFVRWGEEWNINSSFSAVARILVSTNDISGGVVAFWMRPYTELPRSTSPKRMTEDTGPIEFVGREVFEQVRALGSRFQLM